MRAAAAALVLIWLLVNPIPCLAEGAAAPPAPMKQTAAEATAKSAGCMSCHTTTDSLTMHTSPGVTLGCADCHGAFADGEKQRDEMPTGANLRTTKLDAAGLKQTITCGRPGTGMPSFDEDAYSLRPCYGNPLGAAPNDL